MKQNPCRYCALATEYKGKHLANFSKDECRRCKYKEEHRQYLISQRKFVMGDRIHSFEELMEQEYVFWISESYHAKHIEVIKSWQYRMVQKHLELGNFYKAIRKEGI